MSTLSRIGKLVETKASFLFVGFVYWFPLLLEAVWRNWDNLFFLITYFKQIHKTQFEN